MRAKFRRRTFVQLAAAATALPAQADTYPSRPVRLVVGFPPVRIGQEADAVSFAGHGEDDHGQ